MLWVNERKMALQKLFIDLCSASFNYRLLCLIFVVKYISDLEPGHHYFIVTEVWASYGIFPKVHYSLFCYTAPVQEIIVLVIQSVFLLMFWLRGCRKNMTQLICVCLIYVFLCYWDIHICNIEYNQVKAARNPEISFEWDPWPLFTFQSIMQTRMPVRLSDYISLIIHLKLKKMDIK